MSDTSYATVQHYGTAAERAAFVPNPPATAQFIYIWYETDTGTTWLFDTSWHQIAGASADTIAVSAGAQSSNLSGLTFSNSNGVSFGLSDGTITASVAAAGALTNIKVSAGASSALLSALTFSNSNGLAFGLSAGTITGSYTVPTITNSSWTVSASGGSQTVGNLVFSNSNGITFGISTGATGTITASFSNAAQSNQTLGIYLSSHTSYDSSSSTYDARSLTIVGSDNITLGWSNSSLVIKGASGGGGAAATLSYYENIPFHGTLASIGTLSSRMYIYPFVVPQAVSIGLIVNPISISFSNRTFGGTTANTSWTASLAITYGFEIFTKGTGASSLSLSPLSTFSISSLYASTFSAGNTGSQYSVSQLISFHDKGSQTSASTTYACTSASYVINSSFFNLFGNRMQLQGAGVSSLLNPGNYWMGFGSSSDTGNNGATALSQMFNGTWPLLVSQANFQPGFVGENSGNSDNYNWGAGEISTNTQFWSTGAFDMGIITSLANNPVVPFQFRNY